MKNETITLAIADDHTMFRKGLILLLTMFPEFKIEIEVSNGQELIDSLAKSHLPDIVLMDVSMPKLDGFETTVILKSKYPDLKILALSSMNDEQTIIKMIRCGACGFLDKDSNPRDLHQVIKKVHEDGVFVSSDTFKTLFHDMRGNEQATDMVKKDVGQLFTDKEMDFIRHCCTEKTLAEIATSMNKSYKTVDGYARSVYKKAGVQGRIGLVLFAVKTGLLSAKA